MECRLAILVVAMGLAPCLAGVVLDVQHCRKTARRWYRRHIPPCIHRCTRVVRRAGDSLAFCMASGMG